MHIPTDLPDEIIQVKDRFYILATSPLADDRIRVLKQSDLFAVFDRHGDVQPVRFGEQGLYFFGTRHLSRCELRISKSRPFLLSSNILEDNRLLCVDQTNPDIYVGGQLLIPRGTLHIFRSKFLWNGVCYERIRVWNYGSAPAETPISFLLDADFVDIFEVRGTKRAHRGEKLPDRIQGADLSLSYRGLDGVARGTRVECSPKPDFVSSHEFVFNLRLAPQEEAVIYISIACHSDEFRPEILSFDEAAAAAQKERTEIRSAECVVRTSNEQLNDWLNRSSADLHMMITKTPEGYFPYAGVPWFSTVFGRDGLITSMEYLWMNPLVAQGVLGHLAAHQANQTNADQDAEPGKILHETRGGEMARLKEIPFGRYYGSVDSTPLFISLAGAYYDRTADRAFMESIWPSIERALYWIDNHGDMDGDGFVEYSRRAATGLVNQGWKDSEDSVFHEDGTQAVGPIALCEVQGYVFQAKQTAARLARVFGKLELAHKLEEQADELQRRFEQSFWCEDLGTYALALDGDKKPCRVRTSNAGHALFSGIASQAHAERTAATLMSAESFSGWGVRTVASSESLYNPMSYHNGSIWPHDNAMIALGLARYGIKQPVLEIMAGLFQASITVDLHRLPELLCGFHRRTREAPTLYPVACSPQAWAAASLYMLLQAALGLHISAPNRKICFNNPVLPPFARELEIKNLRVGNAVVDLHFEGQGEDVEIGVPRREGDVEIVTIR